MNSSQDYARESVEDRPRFLEELFAAVSHQLRTPLTIVLGMARLLEQRLAPEGDHEVTEAVNEINLAAEWMERSIDQMLLLSQLEMQSAAPEPILLRAIARGAVAHHSRSYPDAEVRIEGCEPGILGYGVPSWVLLIMTSLLENAARYGDGRHETVVAISQNDRCTEIAISSSGKPCPAEERDRWFEPFYTRPVNDSTGASAGLGLTLARKLAEQQGGDLRAEDCREFEGTTFRLRLPRSTEACAA